MRWFLIFIILVGILSRFIALDSFLQEDEKRFLVSSIKIYHESFNSGRLYMSEHPPLARWFAGIPSMFVSEYNFQPAEDLGNYEFIYIFYREIAANLLPIRLMSAIVGTLAVALVYIVTKNTFNKNAALFSAALMAISADFIFFSKMALTEIYMAFFALASIHFYFKFIKERGRKKYGYALLLFLFLTFLFGSRPFQPLFLAPAILLGSYFVFRSEWKTNIIVTGIVIAALISIFLIIWPPNISNKLFSWTQIKSPLDALGFSLPETIYAMIFRHSYIFLLSIIATAYFVARKKFTGILNNSQYKFFILFFAVCFLGIAFSSFGETPDLMRFSFIMAIPLYVLGGGSLSKIFETNVDWKILIILIFLISFFSLALEFTNNPDFSLYVNFGVKKYVILYQLQFNEVSNYKDIIKFLNDNTGPPIYSNNVNMLIFYKSSSGMFNIPAIIHNELRCNQQAVDAIKQINPAIVYQHSGSELNNTIKLDGLYCKLIADLPLEEVYRAGKISVYQILQN